jgi:hypothetical protein
MVSSSARALYLLFTVTVSPPSQYSFFFNGSGSSWSYFIFYYVQFVATDILGLSLVCVLKLAGLLDLLRELEYYFVVDGCILSSFVSILAKALLVRTQSSTAFILEATVENLCLVGLLYTTHNWAYRPFLMWK